MKSSCAVILTGVFSEHCLVKMLSVSVLVWNLNWAFQVFLHLVQKMLVLSVMTNTAQFESAEEREQEAETEEMWPWPGVILESEVNSTGVCST